MRNISIVMHNLYLLLLLQALLMSEIYSIFQLFIYNVNIYKLEAYESGCYCFVFNI